MASRSRELVAELVASEGEPDISLATEVLGTDELPETASSYLAGTGASPAAVGVSSMDPIKVSTTVEGAPEDIVEEAIGRCPS